MLSLWSYNIIFYNYTCRCYSKVDQTDMEAASHIILQKFKGILHLKTC